MNGPRVMCNGCALVEVPLVQPFCDLCSEQVMQQLAVPLPAATDPQDKRTVIGPFDV